MSTQVVRWNKSVFKLARPSSLAGAFSRMETIITVERKYPRKTNLHKTIVSSKQKEVPSLESVSSPSPIRNDVKDFPIVCSAKRRNGEKAKERKKIRWNVLLISLLAANAHHTFRSRKSRSWMRGNEFVKRFWFHYALIGCSAHTFMTRDEWKHPPHHVSLCFRHCDRVEKRRNWGNAKFFHSSWENKQRR